MVSILFEDNHLIAAFKKSGQTVQPEPGKPISLEDEVKAYLKEKYQKEGAVFLGVIHRLDMPVSGIVLFARTSKALVRMNEVFQKREVQKIYEAWVEHKPPQSEDTITHWLRRDEHKNFTKAFTSEVKNADMAQLKYRVMKYVSGKSLLEVTLLTGRKHQIRVQLSAIGCPIVGDMKYGSRNTFKDQSILLRACKLSFIHPVQQTKVEIEADGLNQLF